MVSKKQTNRKERNPSFLIPSFPNSDSPLYVSYLGFLSGIVRGVDQNNLPKNLELVSPQRMLLVRTKT
jgi:hypothetical protein